MEPLVQSLPVLVKGLGATAEDALHAAVAVTTTDLVSKSAALEVRKSLSLESLLLAQVYKGLRSKIKRNILQNSSFSNLNLSPTLLFPLHPHQKHTPDRRQRRQDPRRGLREGIRDDPPEHGDDARRSITTDAAVEPSSGRRCSAPGPTRLQPDQRRRGHEHQRHRHRPGERRGGRSEQDHHARDPGAATLQRAVTALLQGLAKSVAWDGEGATCLLEVTVTGAASDADARLAAKAVASSSLAKAAVFGHDPNWGRIACAAGYSGAAFDQNDLDVSLGEIGLMRSGQPLEFDAKKASTYLKETTAVHGTVEVKLSLGKGTGRGDRLGLRPELRLRQDQRRVHHLE